MIVMARTTLRLLAGLALTAGLVACSSSSTQTSSPVTTVEKTKSTGPNILVPRNKDIVGPKFAVAGTNGTSGVMIRAAVSGPYSGEGDDESKPQWKVDFDAGTKEGEHTATASAKFSAVQFTIKQAPPITFLPVKIVSSVSGTAVTVSGKHTASSPTIEVKLFEGTSATPFGTKNATVTGADWTVTFDNVQAGIYAAEATLTSDANRPKSSQFIEVP